MTGEILQHCSKQGCDVLVTSGRCAKHAIRARPSDQPMYGYARAHWRKVRRARLALDGHRCKLRLAGCTQVATTVHLDSALEGRHDLATLDNTLSACAQCHGRLDGGRAER